MRITLTLSFILTFLSSVFSQGKYSLDTVVVTTAQVPLKTSETGRNITIITAKQINSLPATSLDEILQTVPGLEVQSRGGFGVQADITLRGATFSQVLLLVDGMKLNDPLTAHFNGYIPVTPAEIERIEILRGPAAAMYGADAVGGVINIITKTFSHTKEGTHISGTFNYGDHKLVSGNQGFSVKKGAATFGGGFSMNQSEGEFFPAKYIDSTTTLGAYNNYFDLKTVGVSFRYTFNNQLSIRVRSAFDYRDFGARYFYTSSTADKAMETVGNWWNHLQIVKTGQNSSTDFNAAYKNNTDEFVFSPDFPSTNNHVSQLLNFTLNHLQVVNNQITVKAGTQFDQRTIESNDRGNHEDAHFGAYAMGVYQRSGLNLSMSLRGDYDANYGFEFSPQLNVSYILPSLTIRGSAGRSIRAADYTERYVSNNLQNLTPGRSLGNPDLLAERAWSEEIGLDYSLSKNWQLRGTIFTRQSTNLIDYVSTNQSEIGSVSQIGSLQENASYFFAKNISNVNTSGFEVESHLRQPLGSKGMIQWNMGYTFLKTTNEDGIVSVYISSHARHLVTTQLMVRWNRIELAVSGLYKERNGRIATAISSELTKSYDVWNTRLGFQVTEQFGINLQLQNIFNEQYQNILGANMPSRWFMAGVKWAL
ncbi:MAG: TonB-dependent receptor [Bacteroidia bacterium]